jgi:hypothetical protein
MAHALEYIPRDILVPEYVCGNHNVLLDRSWAITPLVNLVNGLDNTDSPTMQTHILNSYLYEYNLERRHGIHHKIYHRMDHNMFQEEFSMAYGFCSKEDETVFVLKGNNFRFVLDMFLHWYNERKHDAKSDRS